MYREQNTEQKKKEITTMEFMCGMVTGILIMVLCAWIATYGKNDNKKEK